MYINDIVKACLTPLHDRKSETTIDKSTVLIYVIMALLCAVMSIMNMIKGFSVMAVTTIILSASCVLLCFIRKKRIAVIIGDAIIVVLFTYYALSGGNYGFAILWILVAPIFCMGFFSLQAGLITGIYFFILLIIMFFTPLKVYFQEYYTETFIARFPYLYLADFVISSVFMIQRHIIQLKQLSYQKELQNAVKKERKRVADISMQTILSISHAVDAKDKYTQEHSQRVSEYSCLIAEELGWDKEKVDSLRQIALLHDIGKIAVSDTILNKPSRLTDDEYAIMKTHVTAGGEILKDLNIIENVALGALYHHERYDGKGYPKGLKGKDIPIEARIIGIADAFDAMNSNRIYRKHLSADEIHNEIIRCRGSQFDPELADVFLPIADKIMSEQ